MVTTKLKNIALMALPVLNHVPSMFYNEKTRLQLGLFHERTSRIDMFFFYYVTAIDLFILAICLHYSKFIDRRVTRFVLIINGLDLIHLALYAKQGFGMAKIGLAFLILYLYQHLRKS